MSYAKRTCHECGYRDIQPNMKQIEIEYVSGTSQKAISAGSLVGAWVGDKRAGQQNADAIFGTTKRKYKRKRKVWVCKNNCNSSSSTANISLGGKGIIGKIFAGIFQLILMLAILFVIILIFA